MTSILMPKLSPSKHLEMARLRLRDSFKSKFLDAVPKQQPLAMNNMIPKTGIASAILAEEMSPNHLEEARHRIRSRYQDSFSHSHHNQAIMTHMYPTAVPLGSYWRSTDNEYIEAARMRLRSRFQSKFMPTETPSLETAIDVPVKEVPADEFVNFPKTVGAIPEALASSWGQAQAIVVTSAQAPFLILHVNSKWSSLCGFSQDEAVGNTFKSLGINASGITERDRVEEMMRTLNNGGRASVHLTNLTKNGNKFTNYLRIAPVKDEITGEVAKFLGVLEDVSSEKISMAA